MPRHPYKKLKFDSDPVYKSAEVAKFINYVMLDGKKTVAERLIYDMMVELKNEGKDPLQTLHEAITNVAPRMEVKPKRLGGASYLVPIDVRKERKIFLALNWIIEAAKTRSNKEFGTFDKKLLQEIKDAATNVGAAVAKRAQIEKMADQNRAFSHLKW